MKTNRNPLTTSCFLFILLWLISCTPTASPEQTYPFPDTLQSGESARLELKDSHPTEVEANPLFIADLTITDANTGQPIAADTFIYKKIFLDSDLNFIQTTLTIPCEESPTCQLALTPTGEDSAWVIQIRARGYTDQVFELKTNTLTTRKMDMPIQMSPIGTDI